MTRLRDGELEVLERIHREESDGGMLPHQGHLDRRFHTERAPRAAAVHGKTLAEVGTRHSLWEAKLGVDCGDGWADILDRLFTDLRALGWSERCVQIKEKLGALRVYLSLDDGRRPAIHHRVRAAEEESASTCEECGRRGRLRRSGEIGRVWTLCDDDALAEGYPTI